MFTFYRKLLLLCLATAVFSSTQAQKRTILKKNDTIKLEFDEYGKLKSAPPGFVLKSGRKYLFDVTTDTAKKRQKELFEFVKKNLAATLARLDNPDDNFSMVCKTYLVNTDMVELQKEMNELYEILNDKKPVEAFGKNRSAFKYFLGRNFLQTSLFFDAADYKPHFDQGATARQKGKGGGSGSTSTIKATDDSLEITLKSVDFRKKFLSDYFTESMLVYGSVFNKIKPVSFYANDIRRDDKLALSIYKIQKELSGLIQQRAGRANPEAYFCDAVLYNEYLSILDQINAFEKDNNLISILKTNWLASWLWFEEGALTLSPLGYTSPELLDRINISDTARSVVFDRYIDSLINRMIISPELTEPRARVALMDSLLKLRGTGKARYSKNALIQQMEKENKLKKIKAEEVNTIAQQLVFRSVKPGKLDGAFVGGFDASGSLKKMESKRSFTVPNDFNQEVLVYNLKPGQDFTVTKTAENIPDQSKLISNLNEVGDMFSTITGGAASALPGFSGLFKEKLISGSVIKPFILNYNALNSDLMNKSTKLLENKNKDYFLNFTLKNGLLRAIFSAEVDYLSVPPVELDELYENYWRSNEFGNCALVRKMVEEKMVNFFNRNTFTIEGRNFNDDALRRVVDTFNKQMDLITKEVSDELNVSKAYNKLGNLYNYFATLDSVFEPVVKHQLPPSEMELVENKTPSFRSRYETLEKETGAKQVKYEVTLTDVNAITSIKLKNTYKTAPTHWITGSLGVGYINNSYRRSEVTVTNGVITNSPDEDNVRLLMGLNFHIWPVILADDRSIFNMKEWRQVRTRLSLFAGASFPKPWYNLHAGLSVDVWAGLKLTGGVHFYRHTYYQVLNNQVTDEKSRYESNGAFFGVTMDPGTFVKLIGIFK